MKKQQQEISTRDIVSVALGVLMEVSAMACLVYFTQHTECETFEDVKETLKFITNHNIQGITVQLTVSF